jgi:hypothetical protein
LAIEDMTEIQRSEAEHQAAIARLKEEIAELKGGRQ